MERIERKLRRFRRIEASYHKDIKRALEASRANTVSPVKAREKYEKYRAKCERKMGHLQPKIKALTERRETLKHSRARKG